MLARPILVAAVLALGAGCQRPHAAPLPREAARELLINRNWIDRLPQKADDKIHVFRFVPAMGGGVFQDRTIFAGAFELFQFRQDGATLELDLLHTGERRTVRFTIENVAPARRGDADLKLTLDRSPRGPSVYYGWRQGGGDVARMDAQLAALPSL